MNADKAGQAVPLCVDLDGTLILTDTLWIMLVQAAKTRPWNLICALFWLLKGRPHLKAQMTRRVPLDYSTLPWNEPLMGYLRKEKAQGRHLVLVTAANIEIARRAAEYTGLFDVYFGSDEHVNLKSRAKAALLRDKFGAGSFDYAGNSSADLPVWHEARRAIVVNAPEGLAVKIAKPADAVEILPGQGPRRWMPW